MPRRTLRHIDTTDIAVIPPAIGRGVLPLMLDEHLIASAVVEEERGHRADRRIAGSEVRVHETGSRAWHQGHARNAGRISRRLHGTRWDDEVAVHAAAHPSGHRAWRASVGDVA